MPLQLAVQDKKVGPIFYADEVQIQSALGEV